MNLGPKKSNWLSRYVRDLIAAVDQLNAARTTASEYSTDAFNGGDQVNRAGNTITDADLVALGFPHLTAAMLNASVGGLNALAAAYDANAGVIEAARP